MKKIAFGALLVFSFLLSACAFGGGNSLTYVNDKYKFSLDMPKAWEGYEVAARVMDELSGFNGTELLDVGFPKLTGKSVEESSVLALVVYTKAQWEEEQKIDGPIPALLGNSGDYVIAYSALQDFSSPEMAEKLSPTISSDIQEVVASFKAL